MLAITEGLLGQIYLVTIVALLVSNIGQERPARRLARMSSEVEAELGEPERGGEGEPSGVPQDDRAQLPDGGG
jgi:hypothetical protein